MIVSSKKCIFIAKYIGMERKYNFNHEFSRINTNVDKKKDLNRHEFYMLRILNGHECGCDINLSF
jgi:hypothetical protein